ncbi:unnamed protein product [Spirodela intermedia]|uniref:Uncharacterized protein n=1 Tax=Spirodela intermedia TaxID=51605 RepID=A0A7I8KF46_SPIIN|nr:unnamed protein product [Spirodela intermedia]
MDLETENRLATMLMEEARRLRLQADKEGVGVYLHQPKVRGRPNSRFLTATVVGVQQANRAVEVNEMWRAREKELELDSRLSHRDRRERHQSDQSKESPSSRNAPSSSKHKRTDFLPNENDGLRDEEVEEFLQSRMKRGRGAVGSRMDEPGPYPVCTPSSPNEKILPSHEVSPLEESRRRRVLGPEKPASFLPLRKQLKEASSSRRDSTKVDDDSRSKRRRRCSEDVECRSEESRDRRKKDKKQRHRRRSR